MIGVTDRQRLAGIGHLYIDGGQSWFVGGALDRDSPAATSIAAGLLRSARRMVGERLQVELDDWMTDVASVTHTLDHVILDEALIVIGHPAREHDHESPADS